MKIKIDGQSIKSLDDLHMLFKSSIELPPYYGQNLDALYDVLSDDDYQIELINEAALRKNLGDSADAVISLFKAVNDMNS